MKNAPKDAPSSKRSLCSPANLFISSKCSGLPPRRARRTKSRIVPGKIVPGIGRVSWSVISLRKQLVLAVEHGSYRLLSRFQESQSCGPNLSLFHDIVKAVRKVSAYVSQLHKMASIAWRRGNTASHRLARMSARRTLPQRDRQPQDLCVGLDQLEVFDGFQRRFAAA